MLWNFSIERYRRKGSVAKGLHNRLATLYPLLYSQPSPPLQFAPEETRRRALSINAYAWRGEQSSRHRARTSWKKKCIKMLFLKNGVQGNYYSHFGSLSGHTVHLQQATKAASRNVLRAGRKP